jgi:hypothetical protein
MARSTNKQVATIASATSPSGWTAVGGGTLAEILGRTSKPEGENPATEKNATGEIVTKKKLEVKLKWAALAAGEIPIKVVVWVSWKTPGAAKALIATLSGIGAVEVKAESIKTEEQKWVKLEVTGRNLEGMTLAEIEAGLLVIETKGTSGGFAYEVYAELETETERAILIERTRGEMSTPSLVGTSAEAEVGGTKGIAKGLSMFVIVSVAGPEGATGVADTQGNTYVLDKEEHNAVNSTVQLWRAPITTALVFTNKVKATFPVGVEGHSLCIVACASTAIQTSSPIDVSAANPGATGTAVSVTLPSTREGKGDLVVMGWAETSNTSNTAVAPLVLIESGTNGSGGYIPKPAEGSAVKPEATIAEGKWTAVAVAYKVLAGGVEPAVLPLNAASGASAASMSLNAPTQVSLAAAAASSAASMSLNASTEIPLSGASSGSAASMTLSAPAQLPLVAAASTSTATLALNAPTQIPLAAASSTSIASLGVTAQTYIALSPAVGSSAASLAMSARSLLILEAAKSSSEATCTVSIKGKEAILELSPARSESAASLGIGAPTRIPLESASSVSTASMSMSAKTQIPLAPALSGSLATLSMSAKTFLPLIAALSTSNAFCTVTVLTAVAAQSSTTRVRLLPSSTRATLPPSRSIVRSKMTMTRARRNG